MRPPDPTTDPSDRSGAAVAVLWGPLFVAVIALVLLVPVVDLDPVRGITASNSPFTDEVWNVLNARNLILLGTWSTDEWNLHLLNGPFSLVEAAVFAAFGVGMVQARLVAIACTALTGAAIVFGLQRWVGRAAAIIAAGAYVTSALALFYGRMAYVEPMTGLFLVVGLLTLTAIDSRPTKWGAIAGLAFGLAIASKALAIPLVGAALLATGWFARSDPQLRRWLTGAAFALAGAALAWAVVVWLPHRGEIGLMVTRVLPQLRVDLGLPTIGRALGYLVGTGDDRAIALSLPLLLAALGGAALALRDRANLARHAAVLYAVAAFGFAVSIAVVAAVSYHPNRYIVPFLPVGAILIGPLVQSVGKWLAARPRLQGLGLVVTSALLAALCVPGLVLHRSWIASATRELPALQAAAIEAIPPGQVVAGPYSALVALRAPVVALVTCCQAQPANAGDLYAEHGARYVVSGSTPPDWVLNHPAAWEARATLLCFTWDVSPHEFCLYRLP